MHIVCENDNIILKDCDNFNIELTLDCGQSFRWVKDENGDWCGIAGGNYLKLKQEGNDVTLYNVTPEIYNDFWKTYFDLDRDYKSIIEKYDDESLKAACNEYPGIRILKQDEWEAICSFIISANNNIPRIKGIIERLC